MWEPKQHCGTPAAHRGGVPEEHCEHRASGDRLLDKTAHGLIEAPLSLRVPALSQENPLEESDATSEPDAPEPTPEVPPDPGVLPAAASQTVPEIVEAVADKLETLLAEMRALKEQLKDPS